MPLISKPKQGEFNRSPKSFFNLFLSLMLNSCVNILQFVLLMLYGFFLGILNICITKIRTLKLFLLPSNHCVYLKIF